MDVLWTHLYFLRGIKLTIFLGVCKFLFLPILVASLNWAESALKIFSWSHESRCRTMLARHSLFISYFWNKRDFSPSLTLSLSKSLSCRWSVQNDTKSGWPWEKRRPFRIRDNLMRNKILKSNNKMTFKLQNIKNCENTSIIIWFFFHDWW